jgi:hypothetical protein
MAKIPESFQRSLMKLSDGDLKETTAKTEDTFLTDIQRISWMQIKFLLKLQMLLKNYWMMTVTKSR